MTSSSVVVSGAPVLSAALATSSLPEPCWLVVCGSGLEADFRLARFLAAGRFFALECFFPLERSFAWAGCWLLACGAGAALIAGAMSGSSAPMRMMTGIVIEVLRFSNGPDPPLPPLAWPAQ